MEKEIRDEQKNLECCSFFGKRGHVFACHAWCKYVMSVLFLIAFVGGIFCIGYTVGSTHGYGRNFDGRGFQMMQERGCGGMNGTVPRMMQQTGGFVTPTNGDIQKNSNTQNTPTGTNIPTNTQVEVKQ
jgi:hypothetical protein